MVVFRPLIRWLVRTKGKVWVALTALRIYRRLPRFAQRRVRKRAIRAWPKIMSRLLAKQSDERR